MTAVLDRAREAWPARGASIEEYFRRSDESFEKLEFLNGEIAPKLGAAFNHNLIATNVMATLHALLRETDLIVNNSDTKIYIPARNSFVYPDAVIVSHRAELYEGRPDIILNPLLVVEVASPSTRGYDLGRKAHYYRTLSSLQEYVFVENAEPWASSLFLHAPDSWHATDATGLGAALMLRSVGVALPLAEVYRKVLPA